MEHKRRRTDSMNNDNLIKDLMSNGNSTKYLVAKMYVDFSNQFTRLNGKVKWHDKFIWTFIGILITAFIGGLIGLIINYLIHLGG